MDNKVNRSSACCEMRNGTLLTEPLVNERADSPAPGLVEGTEPGAIPKTAVFVHSLSFEDLTADTEQQEPPANPVRDRQELGVPEEEEEEEEEGAQDPELGGALSQEKPQEQDSCACPEAQRGGVRAEVACGEDWRRHRKHIIVLSEAGKPIYTRYGTPEALSSTAGVMMALVSVLEADKNAIRSIHADGCKVVFLSKSPLVLVGVSRTSQPERELLRELHYVYYQIVSLLTLTQLQHVFQRRQNYDLRRLLSGSEHLTDRLLGRLEREPGLLLRAVTCLPLAASARDAISAGLQAARADSLVFSVLLAGDRLVSLLRRRDQFLHHVDLHLLCNLVGASACFREGEAWTPVCLPKFNASGFLHAHVSHLEPRSELCLVLVSADREDFFAMSDCKHRFMERLGKRAAAAYLALKEALKCPGYSVAQVAVAELRHFLYKSKSSGLYTSPELPGVYQGEEQQQRLMELYQDLHSRLHHPTRPLRSIYRCGERENLLAWVTSGFEVYLCFSPMATKAVAVAAVTKLLKWIRKEEDRLFILSPLTY